MGSFAFFSFPGCERGVSRRSRPPANYSARGPGKPDARASLPPRAGAGAEEKTPLDGKRLKGKILCCCPSPSPGRAHSLGNGVMAARVALNHLVGVRVPVPQKKTRREDLFAAFFRSCLKKERPPRPQSDSSTCDGDYAIIISAVERTGRKKIISIAKSEFNREGVADDAVLLLRQRSKNGADFQ